MKFFKFDQGAVTDANEFPEERGIAFSDFGEVEDIGYGEISSDLINKIKETKFTVYERKENYQYLVLNTPNTQSGNLYEKIVIYMDMRGILIFSDNTTKLSGVVGDFADKLQGEGIEFFLSAFLSSLLAHDYIFIEGVEKDLGKIETEILTQHTPNYPDKINSYRRKVAVIKRYYEQLYEVTDVLAKEDFLSNAQQSFQEINTKVERLREEALYLRDYMSQVREAYQQAIDLSLNSVMKFLTAATLVFSPLQFMVGWFGMNFEMPELEWARGYVIPFILSSIVIMTAIFIFKKKKWF